MRTVTIDIPKLGMIPTSQGPTMVVEGKRCRLRDLSTRFVRGLTIRSGSALFERLRAGGSLRQLRQPSLAHATAIGQRYRWLAGPAVNRGGAVGLA